MNFRFARNTRLAIRFGRRLPRVHDPQLQLTSAIAADPRARLRRGSFVASDGEQVPYRLWLSRVPRAAVLLLHGAFDYSAAFDEIGPRLARAGFTALAFDQRGFGATASRGRWSGSVRMAKDVASAGRFLLTRIGAEIPLFVLGESMGGAVAIHAAARGDMPELKGLVLAAPGALASRFRQRLLTWLAMLARVIRGDAEFVFERLSGWELTPAAAIRLIGDPLVMRRIRPEMLCGMAELALSTVEEARKVTVPALVMIGARDELVRTVCIHRLFDNLAGEKVCRVVPEAPHLLLHWQQSGEIVRESVAWMAARSRPDEQQKPVRLSRNPRGAGTGLD